MVLAARLMPMVGQAAPEAAPVRTGKDLAVAALAVAGLATALLAAPVPPPLAVPVAVVAVAVVALEELAEMLPASQVVLVALLQQPSMPLLHL